MKTKIKRIQIRDARYTYTRLAPHMLVNAAGAVLGWAAWDYDHNAYIAEGPIPRGSFVGEHLGRFVKLHDAFVCIIEAHERASTAEDEEGGSR